MPRANPRSGTATPRAVQHISAYQATGRPGFVVNFPHPLSGQRVSRSLGTRDELEARKIAWDLERLANTPDLWKLAPEDPAFITFDERSLSIFLGRKPQRTDPTHTLTPKLKEAIDALAAAGFLKHVVKIEESSPALADERRLRVDAEQRAAKLEREKASLVSQLERFQRAHNHHVKATLGEAQLRFEKNYAVDHAPSTIRHVHSALQSFVQTLGPAQNVARVRAREIEEWLLNYKGGANSDEDVSMITRARLKAYVRIFWKWAVREYDLSENPMDRCGTLAGGSRAPEHILAVRRLDELNALLEGLRPWPYWRAWVAVAVFAGPRWAEQQWLKVDDVYLKEGYLRITARTSGPKRVGTKTGRERNVPIERTTLLPILKDYLNTRESNYPWLFPSLLDHSVVRKKTLMGLWSGSSAFLDSWNIVQTAAALEQQDAHIRTHAIDTLFKENPARAQVVALNASLLHAAQDADPQSTAKVLVILARTGDEDAEKLFDRYAHSHPESITSDWLKLLCSTRQPALKPFVEHLYRRLPAWAIKDRMFMGMIQDLQCDVPQLEKMRRAARAAQSTGTSGRAAAAGGALDTAVELNGNEPNCKTTQPDQSESLEQAGQRAPKEQYGAGAYWTFGPSEWRHTFGTILGMCGYSGVEIARMMGNSPAIADRHYISIASEDTGQRWPFRWR